MEYTVTYKVLSNKKVRKEGVKLGISSAARKAIIKELKLLKFWPENKEQFDFESVNGCLKFNFDHVEGHWIRVFVYQDDVRKVMWVFKVISKKTNKLTKADLAGVDAFVREIELAIQQELSVEKKKQNHLKIIKGGRDE